MTYIKSHIFDMITLFLILVFLPVWFNEHTYMSGIVTGTSLMVVIMKISEFFQWKNSLLKKFN